MGQTQTKYIKKIKNKRRPKFDCREEYFIKNGGILLEKQIALSQGQHKGAGQLKVFSSQDIAKATNNYDPDLIVGNTADCIVYKTTIDDRVVVVKTSLEREPNPELIDLFLTEASTVMVMNHDNMVKLYGCCLETCIPILVYEYLSNGGLSQWLHGDVASNLCIKWVDCLRVATDVASNLCIEWVDRLRVATDVAYALSYMHNALSKPVVHRDVNSLAILLDYSFNGKLANFFYSVTITPGETPAIRWPVEGTPGYIDPEYIETQEVTEKCDVYSFGVLMLELLTRKQPLIMARGGIDLVEVFVSAVQKNCMMEMVDTVILEQASMDEIRQFVQLALMCVAKKGTERPNMVNIVGELWKIQGRDKK